MHCAAVTLPSSQKRPSCLSPWLSHAQAQAAACNGPCALRKVAASAHRSKQTWWSGRCGHWTGWAQPHRSRQLLLTSSAGQDRGLGSSFLKPGRGCSTPAQPSGAPDGLAVPVAEQAGQGLEVRRAALPQARGFLGLHIQQVQEGSQALRRGPSTCRAARGVHVRPAAALSLWPSKKTSSEHVLPCT